MIELNYTPLVVDGDTNYQLKGIEDVQTLVHNKTLDREVVLLIASNGHIIVDNRMNWVKNWVLPLFEHFSTIDIYEYDNYKSAYNQALIMKESFK